MGDVSRKVPAGGSQEIAIAGGMIYARQASGPFAVLLNGSDRYRMQQGDKLRPGAPFTTFRIEDISGNGVDVALVVNSGDFSQSVIAQAVRVTNEGSEPLPVNIAGQSLPDRPYLRAKQTFAAWRYSYRQGTKMVSITNPNGSGVNIIDPIASLGLRLSSISGPFNAVLRRFRENDKGILPGVNGYNKDFSVQSRSAATVNYRVDLPGDDNTLDDLGEISYLSTSSTELRYASEHGGLLVPPGYGVGIVLMSNIPDQDSDGNKTTIFQNWEWIEQPINE